MSVNRRRQALSLCLDFAVVAVIQIGKEHRLEVLHGLEDLRVKQFTFEQTIKFPLSKTATFATHALPDALVFEHALVQLVMVVPTLSARSRCTSASRSSSTSFGGCLGLNLYSLDPTVLPKKPSGPVARQIHS